MPCCVSPSPFPLPPSPTRNQTNNKPKPPTKSDRDVLEHIVYDFADFEMMEALRPSIEEAQPISSQALALDYLGKRANVVGLSRARRIE